MVSIVTPDHWHTKIAIEALQAGKHVFCQKPLTLTLEENRLIRAACKANPKLVFFIGTQQRSDRRLFMRAVNMAQKGLLGELKKITCGINGNPMVDDHFNTAHDFNIVHKFASGLPVSDVYSHLQTMNACHLSAIAGRLKRKI